MVGAMNENFKCEIWEKATHNIPPMFAGQFNKLLEELTIESMK